MDGAIPLTGLIPAALPLRRNIELKARLCDLDEARVRATAIASRQLPPEHQVDTYFCVAHGRLKLREINGSSAQLVWYHRGDAASARASDYLLVPVADPTGLKQVLAGALGVRSVVEKDREIFLYRNVRIHLDRVVGRGAFLEFEAVLDPEQTDQAGHELLAELRRQFAIEDADLLAHSYGDA